MGGGGGGKGGGGGGGGGSQQGDAGGMGCWHTDGWEGLCGNATRSRR